MNGFGVVVKITALIIGRGGSSFRGKNLRAIAGSPLVTWTARAALGSPSVGEKFVSSDDSQIIDSVKEFGYLPIVRPNALASATAKGCDVISHAITVMVDDYGHVPEFILLQHANSATILPSWIDACFEMLISSPEATAVVPVLVEMDKHPYRQKRFLENGFLESFFPDLKNISSNRQELPRSAVLAHNFWLIRTPNGQLPVGDAPWPCLGDRVLGYEIAESLDVHDERDLQTSEEWLLRNVVGKIFGVKDVY